MKFLIRDHHLSSWEELEGYDIEEVLSEWAENVDAGNDYFISRAEHDGIDIEVKEGDSEIIKVYTIYPEFHTSYLVRKKNV